MITHNYETTTILYYTIFLPGVLLHELTYWLAAGIMNVRADRSVKWPEKQDIGELKLNFIRLSPKANPIKRTIIATAPLFVGLMAIWIIAVNVFQLDAVITTAGTGSLEDVTKAISILTSAPDFWLWFYFSFTIANTMFPNIPKDMRGWWQIGGAIGLIVVVLAVLGVGQQFMGDLSLSINQFLNSLSLTLLLTIFINLVMVMILGAIESTIERITGHSATFQKGKMVTMTREEALKLREEEQRKRAIVRSAPHRRTATAGPSSIYGFDFPIPGPPGQEPITKGAAAVLSVESSIDDRSAGISPDDEVIETTATDARQRMLRLFPETTDEQKPSEIEEKVLKAPAQPRPRINLPEPISKPAVSKKGEPENTIHIDDDDVLDRASAKIRPTNDKVDQENETQDATGRQSSIAESKKTRLSGSGIPAESMDDTPDDNEEPDHSTLSKTASASRFQRRDSKVLSTTDENGAEEDLDDQLEDTRLPSRSRINTPSLRQPLSPTSENNDDDTEDEEELVPFAKSPVTSRFQRPDSKVLSPTDANEDEEDEQLSDTPLPSRSRLNAPSLRQPLSPTSEINDGDEEDEEEVAPLSKSPAISRFQRPNSKILSPVDNDEVEDDDLAETLLPSRSRFNAPSLRQPLSTTSENIDEEDEEELGTVRSPRTQSMFEALSKTSSESDEEDEEELGTKLPRRSTGLFATLNTPPTTPTKHDEDEDDEQLSRTAPRPNPFSQLPQSSFKPTSSRFGKPDDLKSSVSPSSDWRSKLPSQKDTDEGKESVKYESIDDEIVYEDIDDLYSEDEEYYDDDE